MVAPVPVVPSPKFHFIVQGAVPPVVVAVNVTGVFTTGLNGRNVKLVESGGGVVTVTVLELIAVCDGDDESVSVSVTVYDCAVVYVWVVVAPVPTAPSPKLQLIAYGAVPPVVVAMNVTGELTIGVEGRNAKLVDGGGGLETVTAFELVAVLEGADESVAGSVMLND